MKCVAKIPLSRIAHISILLGNGRSLDQVKGDADYILNGGFYDMGTGKPTGHLKVGGKVLAKSAWNCWGFRWDTGADIRMDVVPDSGGSNYINGVEMLSPSGSLSYVREVGGTRGRTAIGLTGDSLILYCSGDGTKDALTPEELREEMADLGCTKAIMLDGGGSSQCSFPSGKIGSDRRVHNYIAVWLKDNENRPKEETKMAKVVLDPGHGKETAGKCSPDKSYYEHEFTLDMAKRMKALLERHGVQVALTRNTEKDVSLSNRVKIANSIEDLDLFCSIHSNASGNGSEWKSTRGYGIYTSAKGDTAGRNIAANKILARVKQAGIPLWGGGLHHNISLYVLKNTVAPAVLIEHLFHDNREDVALLKDSGFRDKLAEANVKGILDYLGIPWKEESAEKQACVCPFCGKTLSIVKGE